LEDKIKDFFHI
jgi:hypothetical protein